MDTNISETALALDSFGDKAIEALTLLASELGTTAENLWEILVQQAFIEGIVSAGWASVWSVALISSLVLFYKKYHWIAAEENNKYFPTLFLSYLSLISFCLISSIIIRVSIHDTLTCFLNPGYWALDQILTKVIS